MKKLISIVFLTTFIHFSLNAQKALKLGENPGSIDPSAILELQSSPTVSKGLLLPRVDLTLNPVASPANGLMVYNTNLSNPGIYVYVSGSWSFLASITSLNSALANYQPLNPILTSIGSISTGTTGWLYNNNGVFSYTAPLVSDLAGTLGIANGGTGAITAQAARVNLGLGNVDNTSDLNKPISSATQTALDAISNSGSSALSQEVARATAAEGKLTSDLGTEVNRATAAEGTIANSVTSEVTRATAAELALSSAKQDALNGTGYAKLNGTTVSYTSAIPNTDLANSSITINGNIVALGGSTTVKSNTSSALTFDNTGAGAPTGTTFDGSAAQTISSNTIGAVASNAGITAGTATKITYDAKGLVTLGEAATTADIAASFDKNYVNNDQLTVLSNTSNTNSGDETVVTILARLLEGAITLTPGSSLTGINTGDQIITLSGDVTGTNYNSGTGAFSQSFPATIGPGKVTYSKMQTIPATSLLGNSTAGTGAVQPITIGSGLSFTGTTLSATAPTGNITIGSTALSLGSTYPSLAGLTSVTSTNFIGNLTGNALTATSATTAANISGGSPTSIPYQTGSGATALTAVGTTGQVLTLVGSVPTWSTASAATTFANPTGTSGLTAINGVLTTAMRSDAAPAISQTIAPTWSGLHIFTGGITTTGATTLSFGADATAQTINLGTGAAAKTIAIGSTNGGTGTGSVSITSDGNTSINTGTGSGNINIGRTTNTTTITGTTVNINSGTSTGTITLGGSGGTNTTPQVISIGNNASGTKTINIGNGIGSGTTNINAGTGGIVLSGINPTAAGIITNSSTGLLSSVASISATQGGTGQTGYAIGDLLYASTTTALTKLSDIATGSALISGGTNTAPSWGKIGLTTHVSGILPTANGGTGIATVGNNGQVLTVVGGVPAWANASGGGGTTTNALTLGNGLTGTSFNGSLAVSATVDTTVIASRARLSSSLIGYAPLASPTLVTPIIGAATGTSLSLSGNITASSFVKSSGLATEILAANGTVITAGTGLTLSGGILTASGIPGPTGATGPQGPIGLTGAAGSNGTNGAVGATGPEGPTGPTGTAGTNGTNGAVGATGPSGTNGTNGTNGAVGATGPAGPTGATGATGPAGGVTSIGISVPTFLSVSNSPVTTSGTIALSLSGTALPVTSGGTGQNSALVAGGVMYGSTTTAAAVTAAGTAGQVLLSNGASAPTWSSSFIENKSLISTTTISTSRTLTVAEVLNQGSIVATANNITITFPTGASLATANPNLKSGDVISFTIIPDFTVANVGGNGAPNPITIAANASGGTAGTTNNMKIYPIFLNYLGSSTGAYINSQPRTFKIQMTGSNTYTVY